MRAIKEEKFPEVKRIRPIEKIDDGIEDRPAPKPNQMRVND